MFTIIVIFIIILCILLTLVVLAQAAKGDGLAGGLAAPGSVGTMFGVRRASDFLMKATIIIAGTFILFTMIANRVFLPSGGNAIQNVVREGTPPPVSPSPVQNSAPQSAPPDQAQPTPKTK
ncbi:MAG: preprotein translocase subunit SecG [Bacteroidota bacterium]|nr:preprotein translocase subunit SecG [Bacteroidota bacterium]MDP4231589.1 preprotein translocase subunit SecG [Bacteroidota bacterium]